MKVSYKENREDNVIELILRSEYKNEEEKEVIRSVLNRVSVYNER